jgi:prolyl-tRNA synthetase
VLLSNNAFTAPEQEKLMKKLTSIETNFPQWYQEVIDAAELVDNGPSRGSMVIRPYAYAMWEIIQKELDGRIKRKGVVNAYFPLLIPESFIKREAKHVEGFAPELAIVTHAGGKELDEPLVVRPTSETVIYYMFSKWIKSWRDLPYKVNQWANVVRWEMRTRAFLRSTEFLWQEGHTAHASLEEARDFALEMQTMYADFARDVLAIPTICGEKPESERFAGADNTYTFEAMMQDGKALQMGTSHVLARKFSDAFEIAYQDKDGVMQSPHCTSWGSTTRFIGALVMVHGDDNGLVMPPNVAPIQVIIIPITPSQETRTAVLEKARMLEEKLLALGIRVEVDSAEHKSPGAKFYHWEVRGVPLRIELGPKDLETGNVVIAPRVQYLNEKKHIVAFDKAPEISKKMLGELHEHLLQAATNRLKEKLHQASKLEDFGKKLEAENGFYQVGWCQSPICEEKIKEHKATIRCVLGKKTQSSCFNCSLESKADIIVAKAY